MRLSGFETRASADGAADLDETDVEGLIGACRHERSAERLNYRNGCRDCALNFHQFDGRDRAMGQKARACENAR